MECLLKRTLCSCLWHDFGNIPFADRDWLNDLNLLQKGLNMNHSYMLICVGLSTIAFVYESARAPPSSIGTIDDYKPVLRFSVTRPNTVAVDKSVTMREINPRQRVPKLLEIACSEFRKIEPFFD